MKRCGSRLTGLAAALMAGACLLGLAHAEAAFGPLGQDQRISFMGPEGDPKFYAYDASVAYNPTADEYLVVWVGEEDKSPSPPEREIWARRLSGPGAPLGDPVRVSPPDGDASSPSVAYNPARNEYLVAWSGEIGTSNDFEIFARRLSAEGERLGEADVQISQMGPGGGAIYSAFDPSVAVNPSMGEYLVVWRGDTNTMGLVDDEFEIFGQWVSAEGEEVPPNDFRISQQGTDGNADSDAFNPSVAYNPARNEYLVAWGGEIGTSGSYEIWAQLLSAEGVVVKDDFQLSDMTFGAGNPGLAADPSTGAYLVVWTGNDDPGPVPSGFKIFGQRLTAAGAPTGEDDFRISHRAGGEQVAPSVAHDPKAGEYLVAWEDVLSETEVFAQRLSATGAEVGSDFQLSDMAFGAGVPGVAANPTTGEYLVVYDGNDGPPLHPDDDEIFGRRLGVLPPTLLATDPPGPANENNPRLKGSVDPSAKVDIFTNSRCLGVPVVNDAPGSALNGSGIAVPVADNTLTDLTATASEGTRTSRCSNSIAYTELSPPPPPGVDAAPVVSGFVVSPKRVRAGGRTTFRFRLSERATARIVVERVGRKKRAKRAASLTFTNRPAGQNRVAFRARRLGAGTYRATITATDAGGKRSVPRRAVFSIVRRG